MFNNVRCLCDTRTSCDEYVYEFWRLSNECVEIVLRVGKMKTILYNCILKTEYEIVRLTHDIDRVLLRVLRIYIWCIN